MSCRLHKETANEFFKEHFIIQEPFYLSAKIAGKQNEIKFPTQFSNWGFKIVFQGKGSVIFMKSAHRSLINCQFSSFHA